MPKRSGMFYTIARLLIKLRKWLRSENGECQFDRSHLDILIEMNGAVGQKGSLDGRGKD